MHSIKDLQQEFGQALNSMSATGEPRELYEPIRYLLSIGGKRMRPVSVMLACELFGGNVNDAIYPAMAIEVFHNFTLMHDDIMDNAPKRRGQDTVHEKWDINTAILSGDAMLIQSYKFLEHLKPGLLTSVFPLFNQTAIEVCEGQQLDMNFETADDVTIPAYIKMITYKTAVLLAAALKIGALTAGADEKEGEHLYLFGKHLGIAFQIQDDILDVFADQEKFGKQVGGDIISNKKTFLLLKAMEQSTPQQKQELYDLLHGNHTPFDKVGGVTSLYKVLNIRTLAEQEMEEHYSKAISYLDIIDVAEDKKSVLRELATFVKVREV
ncbi:MAG: geranylgeranyl diphosphate synthase type II [Flavobacteriales bacterium]|jgi:geranylgeranyl diphosphate synthase type II